MLANVSVDLDDAIELFQGSPYPVGRSASGNTWHKKPDRSGGGKSKREGDKGKYQREEEHDKMFFAHVGYLLFYYLFWGYLPGGPPGSSILELPAGVTIVPGLGLVNKKTEVERSAFHGSIPSLCLKGSAIQPPGGRLDRLWVLY